MLSACVGVYQLLNWIFVFRHTFCKSHGDHKS